VSTLIAPRFLIQGMTSGAHFGLTSRSCANGFFRTAALFRSGRAMKPVHGLEIGAGEKSRTQPRAALRYVDAFEAYRFLSLFLHDLSFWRP